MPTKCSHALACHAVSCFARCRLVEVLESTTFGKGENDCAASCARYVALCGDSLPIECDQSGKLSLSTDPSRVRLHEDVLRVRPPATDVFFCILLDLPDKCQLSLRKSESIQAIIICCCVCLLG